jgi:hypothetical protein
MPEFVAERYLSAANAASAARDARSVRSAADQLARDGTPVRFVRSIFIPADETCMYVFEAESIEVVRTVAARASLQVERISEAISEPRTRNTAGAAVQAHAGSRP